MRDQMILPRLIQILQEDYNKLLDAEERTDYSQDWQYKQLDLVARRSEIKRLLDLLNFKDI